MGDHTETVQIDYDPSKITYEELLAVFWKSHPPHKKSWSRQYKNVVFFHNDQQQNIAEASKTALENTTGKTVKTDILPIVTFTMAEDYHQKYLLKQHSLKKEIQRFYPVHEDMVDSTAAARLNGYVGGNGNKKLLLKQIDSLGLTPRGKTLLLNMF